MNFGLAREIYGITPWFVDSVSLPGLLGVLNNVSNFNSSTEKCNSTYIFNPKNSTKIVSREWELKHNDDSFDAIALINLDGPITLNGGDSSYGMKSLSERMYRLKSDSRVKGFVIYSNSGGGASGAVQVMSDAINEIKKTHPVYGCIQKGGMAASACFGILSACDKIYSESGMNIVGSAGTMIEFSGREANTKDSDGKKHIRLYAPKSKNKNKGFEEALNNDNYEVLVDELLKPVNESFISLIENNRPILKGTNFDDGHTVFSKDAVGTFIDGIKSFDEVVESILSDTKIQTQKNNNNSNNLNNSIMTKADLQSKHPVLYSEILKEGATSEADRTGAWLAHLSTDSEAVIAGIESGEKITQKASQELLVKQVSKTNLDALNSESAEDLITKQEGKKGNQELNEVDKLYAGIDSKLKTKNK